MRCLILSSCLLSCFLIVPWPLHAAEAPSSATVTTPAAAPKSATATTPAEAELGRKTAESIEKGQKLVKDEVLTKKLDGIAAQIAPMTQRPDVVYHCKILDSKDLNAMSIPGGTIYFTKGLLDALESDHELAGVMAHEIAHNSLYHIKKGMARASKIGVTELATMIAAVYVGRNSTEAGPGQIMLMSEMVKQALINGYTTQQEAEADRNGVDYLYKLHVYDPVGLYSVILGFEQIENHHPFTPMGYLKTHPYSNERKTMLEAEYARLHIPINLWNVESFRAQLVAPTDKQPGYTVKLGTDNLITFTAADGDSDAKTRATAAVEAINRRLLHDYIQHYDVDLDIYDGKANVRIRNIPVITVMPADAAPLHLTINTLALQTVQKIKDALWRESVKRE